MSLFTLVANLKYDFQFILRNLKVQLNIQFDRFNLNNIKIVYFRTTAIWRAVFHPQYTNSICY